MNLRSSALAVLLAMICAPAAAVPPPPPPASYNRSWRAIEALAPFEGQWNGVEVQHSKWGDLTRRVYRTAKRLGGKDVILLEQGVYNLVDGKPLPEAYDVICFDVNDSSYKAYLPGYRLFTDDDNTSQLVALDRPNDRTLVWSASLKDGGQRRTTVVVKADGWRERIDRFSADGSVRLLSDVTLTRASTPQSP